MQSHPSELLRQMFDAAVACAQPQRQLASHLLAGLQELAPENIERVIVLGAGKASAAMAQALEAAWPDIAAQTGLPAQWQGLVVTRYGHEVPCDRIEIVQAAHPVPDAAGEAAAERMLSLAQSLGARDLVVCLISGGGSALLPLALPGLSLQDKQNLNRQLLQSGASISEMNCVRRHLSAIKGGRLALACTPAPVLNLLISDVPGDAPIDIASGPTVADATSCADALAVLAHYRIDVPEAVREILESGAGESPKPGAPELPRIVTRTIATPRMALQAAADVARAAGVAPYILGDAIEGEAREVGTVHAGIALHAAQYHNQPDTPFALPCVLLSGGETTVTVRGKGRGGRNVEFLLALAVALRGQPGIYALAADTDGVDGQEEIAGALLTPDTLERARTQNLRASAALDNNDGHGFFEALGDAVVTGATLTNVNDFRAIYVGG